MLDVRKCTNCGTRAQVYDTRQRGRLLCRYRSCPKCGHNWKTVEIDAWEYEQMLDAIEAQKGGGKRDAEG